MVSEYVSQDLQDALRVWGFDDSSIMRKHRVNLSPKPETMRKRFAALVDYGLAPNKITRMAKLMPGILGYRAERSLTLFSYLESVGFTREHVCKMVAAVPGIMCFKPARIDRTIQNLLSFGFERAQILLMARRTPGMFSCKVSRHNSVLAYLLVRLGSLERVCAVVAGCPGVLSHRIERTEQVLNVFDAIGLDPAKRPTDIMFSPKVTRGRYAIMVERGDEPTRNSLFVSNRNFFERYDLTRAQVIDFDPGPELFG